MTQSKPAQLAPDSIDPQLEGVITPAHGDETTSRIDENGVVKFLAEHPDLFQRHPQLVENLAVPHLVGGAVSLIEYQLNVLRDSNEELRTRLRNLVRNARNNEDIGRRVHRLTLSLLQCNSIDETFSRLYQALADEFQAEYTAIVLVVAPDDPGDARLGEFQHHSTQVRALFEQVLGSDKPVCGPLGAANAGARRGPVPKIGVEQLQFLFAERAPQSGSGALIPLGVGRNVGFLAVRTTSTERFKNGSGIIFLSQLGEIVSHAVAAFLQN